MTCFSNLRSLQRRYLELQLQCSFPALMKCDINYQLKFIIHKELAEFGYVKLFSSSSRRVATYICLSNELRISFQRKCISQKNYQAKRKLNITMQTFPT